MLVQIVLRTATGVALQRTHIAQCATRLVLRILPVFPSLLQTSALAFIQQFVPMWRVGFGHAIDRFTLGFGGQA